MKNSEKDRSYVKTYREMAVAQLGGVCSQCPSKINLHIHHKNGDANDVSKDNLELLCAKHHLLWHRSDGKVRYRSTIYIVEGEWKNFKKLARLQTGSSASRLLEKWIVEFNKT